MITLSTWTPARLRMAVSERLCWRPIQARAISDRFRGVGQALIASRGGGTAGRPRAHPARRKANKIKRLALAWRVAQRPLFRTKAGIYPATMAVKSQGIQVVRRPTLSTPPSHRMLSRARFSSTDPASWRWREAPVSWPGSLSHGRNRRKVSAPSANPQWHGLPCPAFHRRIAAILANPVPMDEEGVLSPAVLTLAPDAKAAWVTFHDAIEGELPNEPAPQLGSGPFSETPHPPAVALSKSSENRAPSTLWRCGALKGGLRAVSSG
jgi:hypothetical protein